MTERTAVRRQKMATAHVLAIFMILLLLATFVIGTGLMIWRSYDETRERTSELAASSAQVVSANAEWIMETARQILLRVDSSLDAALESRVEGLEQSLGVAVASLPGGAKIYVVAEDGAIRLTTDPEIRDIDIRDREYFSVPAQGAVWYVSGLMVSRLNDEQIFVVSKRLERDGVFAGTAIISFNSNLMRRIWDSLKLDPLSTVSLIRDDGMLVSRFPEPEGPLDLSQYVLFTDYLPQADEGTYDAVSPADGVERVVAYRRIQGSNLIALSSISRKAAFARFYNGVGIGLALITPVALALLAMAVWLDRLLRADARRRDDLAQAVETNQTLFREIHHRVKNNLQAVSSLVSLQPVPQEVKADMTRRIAAMVAVHEHIYRSDQFLEVDASTYIPVIVDNLVGSYGKPVAVTYRVDPITIDREHAMPIGLIVNEVVSNALKYAFPEGGAGQLTLELKPTGDGQGVLKIIDNGPGFDGAAVKRGMGSRLIEGLSAQMQAVHDYETNGGTIFTLTFPLKREQ